MSILREMDRPWARLWVISKSSRQIFFTIS
jgi:hypothetical protein